MTSSQLVKVCDVSGWSIVSRRRPGAAPDWLLTPRAGIDGPVFVFPDYDSACRYAAAHEVHDAQPSR